MTTERNDVTERLNQVYATESSVLDPAWMALMASVLIDEDKPGSVPPDEYAALYNIPIDADAYRREFPEDEPFTHPRGCGPQV
jgi:hypothetical protein